MSVSVRVCVCKFWCPWNSGAADSPGVGVGRQFWAAWWVLGAELRSCERTVRAPDHWAGCPAPLTSGCILYMVPTCSHSAWRSERGRVEPENKVDRGLMRKLTLSGYYPISILTVKQGRGSQVDFSSSCLQLWVQLALVACFWVISNGLDDGWSKGNHSCSYTWEGTAVPSENNPCSGEAEVTRLLLTSSFLTRSQKCHTASFMDCVPTPGEVSDTVRG